MACRKRSEPIPGSKRSTLAKSSKIMLQIEGLSAGYGPVVVLRDVHLEVRPGEMVGLLGRNGAGKTTLISAVAGLLKRAEGSVRLNGTELASLSAHQRVVHGL